MAGQVKNQQQTALSDEAPFVRVAAAEALYALGGTDEALSVWRDALGSELTMIRL